uniref:Poly(ADP-ribose) glycohydrolase n=1 Tax=Steinernema glaseri TaxID=37863 RepID=A0A1I7YLU2_9BILA
MEPQTLFPDLRKMGPDDHVFIDLKSIDEEGLPKPLPSKCQDDSYGWDEPHTVRMPFSTSRMRPDGISESELVKNCLITLCTPQRRIEDITTIIDSYQTERFDYDSLHSLFNKQLSSEQRSYNLKVVIPNMAKLALRLNELITKVCLHDFSHLTVSSAHPSVTIKGFWLGDLQPGASGLSSRQRLPLHVPAAFVPSSPRKKLHELQHVNSSPLLYYALILILGCSSEVGSAKWRIPDGLISVRRNCVQEHVDFSALDTPLCDFYVHTHDKIEDTQGRMLEIDFANKNIGGGVLNSGCVQEEIRFTVAPELIISMLVSECMNDHEAISIVGTQIFCKYKGYGDSFVFDGAADSTSIQRDRFHRNLTEIVAMDATRFASDPKKQLEESSIRREIKKAYTGFDHLDDLNRPIATGNWGCGVFKGDRQLKSLIQLIAASAQKRRELHYFTFGDEKFTQRLLDVYKVLKEKKVSVGALYKLIVSYKSEAVQGTNGLQVLDFVEKSLC